MLPCDLSNSENEQICKAVTESGFVWPIEYPFASPRHIRLYRCVERAEPMLAVEVGPYRGKYYDEGLGPNEFALISANSWNDWTKIRGNPIEFLMENNEADRRRRWPRDELSGLICMAEANLQRRNSNSLLVNYGDIRKDRIR